MDMTIKNQKWSYQVTMENHSFKDVADLEIKYVVFSRQDKAGQVTAGGHQEFQRHEGSTTIKSLLNNDKVTFSTDGIMLEKPPNWPMDGEWASGASSTAKGALRGIWIRVYVGGQMVAEYQNPPELATQGNLRPAAKGITQRNRVWRECFHLFDNS